MNPQRERRFGFYIGIWASIGAAFAFANMIIPDLIPLYVGVAVLGGLGAWFGWMCYQLWRAGKIESAERRQARMRKEGTGRHAKGNKTHRGNKKR